jgi:hypothetical protein
MKTEESVNDSTKAIITPPPAGEVPGAPPALLRTYEDCLAQLDHATKDAQSVPETLKKLTAFFETRISKKSSDKAKDPISHVRSVMENKFKPYTKPAPPASDSGTGGLFGGGIQTPK